MDQNKPLLLISCLSQAFCHSDGKMANKCSKGLGSSRLGPQLGTTGKRWALQAVRLSRRSLGNSQNPESSSLRLVSQLLVRSVVLHDRHAAPVILYLLEGSIGNGMTSHGPVTLQQLNSFSLGDDCLRLQLQSQMRNMHPPITSSHQQVKCCALQPHLIAIAQLS